MLYSIGSELPLEKIIEPLDKLETQPPEPLKLEQLKSNDILKVAFLRDQVGKKLERGFLSNPEVIKVEIEEMERKIMWENVRFGNAGSNTRSRHAYLIEELENTQQSIQLIGQAIGNQTDEEQVLLNYNYSLNKVYSELEHALLYHDPKSERLIDELTALLKLSGEHSYFSVVISNALDKLKRNELFGVTKSQYRPAFYDFLNTTCQTKKISEVPDNSVVYLPSLGFFGKVTGDPPQSIKILIEPERTRFNTGLGATPYNLELTSVEGECVEIDFREGIPNNVDIRRDHFDKIMESFKEKGITKVKTHSFDPTYLVSSLDSGRFMIPHLGGFQVETRELEEGETPKFRYVSREFPYYFMVFDGQKLEDRYPPTNPQNVMAHFHFIPGGISYSDEALVGIVVSPGIKIKLLKWINTLSDEKRKSIFGDRNLLELFI